jgi:hypothetical protein
MTGFGKSYLPDMPLFCLFLAVEVKHGIGLSEAQFSHLIPYAPSPFSAL